MPPPAQSKQLRSPSLPSAEDLCSGVFPSTYSKQLKCQAKPTQSRQPWVLSVECWASLQRISSAGRKLHYLKASVSFDCPLGLLFSVSLLDLCFPLYIFPYTVLSFTLFFSLSVPFSCLFFPTQNEVKLFTSYTPIL